VRDRIKSIIFLSYLLVFLFFPLSIFAAARTFITDIQTSIPTNNNDDRDTPRVYPILLYNTPSVLGTKLAARTLIAGLYNSVRFSLDSDRQANHKWNFFWEHNLTLIYAGDAPVVDGQSVSDESFHANQFGNNVGFQYLFKLFHFNWRGGVRYDFNFYFPYGNTDPTVFIRPDFFFEQGPTLFIEAQEIPPSELILFGIYPLAKLEYKWRHDLPPWGPVGAENDVNQYFRASSLVPFGIPVSKRVIITGRAFGAYVNRPDRIDNIKLGSMIVLGNSTTTLPVPGMYSNEVFAKWSVGGSIGPRVILDREAKSKVAFMPFVHWASYNEQLTGNNLRYNTVWGAGAHIMGRIKKKFLWDVAYGACYGLNRASNPANEVFFHITWVPWYKDIPSPNEVYKGKSEIEQLNAIGEIEEDDSL